MYFSDSFCWDSTSGTSSHPRLELAKCYMVHFVPDRVILSNRNVKIKQKTLVYICGIPCTHMPPNCHPGKFVICHTRCLRHAICFLTIGLLFCDCFQCCCTLEISSITYACFPVCPPWSHPWTLFYKSSPVFPVIPVCAKYFVDWKTKAVLCGQIASVSHKEKMFSL